MVMIELYAHKPPPIPISDAVHPLIVPPSMVRFESVTYKPPPSLAEHSLIVPLLMVIFEEYFAYKPPPAPAEHPLIVPPDMTNVALETWTPPPSLFLLTQFRISPPGIDILNVASDSAVTARLQFSITPPYMLKAESEPLITTQALSANSPFCSVTFSYIFAVALSNTDTKAFFAFPDAEPPLVFPSIVSVPL